MGVLDLMGYVQKQGELGKQQGQQTRLGMLAGQSYSAPQAQQPALLGEMARISPDAAAGQYKQNQGMRDDRMSQLSQKAKLFVGMAKSGNQEAVAAMYPQIAAEAKELTGADVPMAYDPSFLPGLEQLAMMGADATSEPTGLREFNGMTAGFSPEEVAEARRVALGIAPRKSSAAIAYKSVKGADGRERYVAFDPNEVGAQVVGDGASYGSGVSAPQMGGDMFAALESIPGVQVTSGMRSPQDNARVGGVPNSYHLTDKARDILPPRTPEQAQQVRQFASQNGLEIVDEGDHWHLEPRRGGAPAQGANPFVSRSPEEQAALTEQATTDVQLSNLPRELQLRTQAKIDEERGVGAAKVETERVQQAPKRIAQYQQALSAAENVEMSIDKALKLVGPLSTGFLGARSRGFEGSPAYDLAAEIETVKANLGFDRLQQMRDNSPTGGALGQVAIQELIALQSTVANLDPNQSQEQIAANLARIQEHYSKWKAAVAQGLAEQSRLLNGAGNTASQGDSDINSLLDLYK